MVVVLLLVAVYFTFADYSKFIPTGIGRGTNVTSRVSIAAGFYLLWIILPVLIRIVNRNQSGYEIGPFKLLFKWFSFHEKKRVITIVVTIMGLIFCIFSIVGGLLGIPPYSR